MITHLAVAWRDKNKGNSVTHQAKTLALQRIFDSEPDGRTDTMCETNDHLFPCDLVGQK